MKKISVILAMTIALMGTMANASTLAPDGTYVSGNSVTLAPDGTYVGGTSAELTPDGSYVGSY